MRIIAITRSLTSDLKRQHILKYLKQKAEVVILPFDVGRIDKFINLTRTFSIRRECWRERSKKNSFIFRKRSLVLGKMIKNICNNKSDVIFFFEALYSPGLGESLYKPFIIYEDSTPMLTRTKWPTWAPDTSLSKEYSILHNSVYKNASKILATNELCRKSLIKDYGISPSLVNTVYQGCNFNTYLEGKRDINKKHILFVGHEFDRKGGYILLEAFKQVRSTIPSTQLIIVGDSLRIKQDGVTVLGRISDRQRLMDIYEKSHIFVLPSYFDPMPNAAIEAMGLGIPVVVSNSCGTSEIINDGKSGFVVPTGNVNELADRLIHLLRNPSLAKMIGSAGCNLVRKRFKWEIISDNVFEILKPLSENRELLSLGNRNKHNNFSENDYGL